MPGSTEGRQMRALVKWAARHAVLLALFFAVALIAGGVLACLAPDRF
ncbi:hypothetical protein [Cryptosporangium minutisporangium]